MADVDQNRSNSTTSTKTTTSEQANGYVPDGKDPLLQIDEPTTPKLTPKLKPTITEPAENGANEAEARDRANGWPPLSYDDQDALPILTPDVTKPLHIPPRLDTPSQNGAIGSDTGYLDREGIAPPEPSPVGRRSVQFARTAEVMEQSPFHDRNGSLEDAEAGDKIRSTSLMHKLKQLAANASLQTPKSTSFPFPTTPTSETQSFSAGPSPTTIRTPRVPTNVPEEGSDADADAEETGDEATAYETTPRKPKRRIMRRPRRTDFMHASQTAPNTPNAGNNRDESPSASRRDRSSRRRATLADLSDTGHGLSEGEGRERLRDRAWKRGASFVTATGRFLGDEVEDAEAAGPSGRRVGHFRRRSAFAGGGGAGGAMSDGDPGTPRRPFLNAERASSYGAQKWKQVKNTIRQLRQKKDDRVDYSKSAELMAELRAGAPVVPILASMLQRDEHGNRRIPVLLEQIKLRITDSTPAPDSGDNERHWLFTIDLEYGSGPSRMKWTIVRSLTDIYNLHWKYKFARKNEKYISGRPDAAPRPKQPKFPWSAFPYMRSARNVADDSEEDDGASVMRVDDPTLGPFTPDETREEGGGGGCGGGGATSDNNEGGRNHGRRRSRTFLGMRRNRTGITDQEETFVEPQAGAAATSEAVHSKRRYAEKQRKILEKYLQEMIRWLMFRADSNRLCRLLELSALGVRLAAEGSYHGKECYLHIQSSKGLDFRRVLTPQQVMARHTRKWFLVRQNYIVCVESPENMNVYDVYLVDCKFRIVSKRNPNPLKLAAGEKGKEPELNLDQAAPETSQNANEKHHTLTLHTSERKVKLFSRYQTVMRQFEDAVVEMLRQTPWYQKNRFDSFAPVRSGVFAQWLVDGRDYMWNVSRAINMARDVIYIHDWWLSPELYMRRPACISQKWRLDRLLQRKAREGVKVFVIVYRNVEAAIPIDSEYTKFSLLNLHEKIFVQRSPNQFRKNQFFFAHHEKICIVDHDVAFMGGIDLCFGRWDCPQHPLADDKPTGFEADSQPKDAEHCQLFPGKDYSNPRVQDFFRLNEPYEEMYDRSKVPRMPWHDVAMQVVGQPARDLTRHFVQRWNYLRRGRKPTRPLPFLLPPPDSKQADLKAHRLDGTCEVQILRSAAAWSLGIEETEFSIQTAYIKMIEDSEHFVYMENQFFITSTEVLNTKINNRIGDALVDRIIRAHEDGDDWRCVVLIPLMPGFQNTVDEQEGTSIRLILQCQYRSICRGELSIFGRLKSAGIEPEDYIQFYSLRQWGKINNVLATEQLYIHAKTIVVDDRVALIGSANINERSMLGTRDSECAAIVRDTDMIWSTMGGKPYLVGRFAHGLRTRLMREHLGLDVDEILEQERQAAPQKVAFEDEMGAIYGEHQPEQPEQPEQPVTPTAEPPAGESSVQPSPRPQMSRLSSYNHDVTGTESRDFANFPKDGKPQEADSRVQGNAAHDADVAGHGLDKWKSASRTGRDEGRDSVIVNGREVLVHSLDSGGKGTLEHPKPLSHERTVSSPADAESGSPSDAVDMLPPTPGAGLRTADQLGLPHASQLPTLPVGDDTDIGGPAAHLDSWGKPAYDIPSPMASDIKPAFVDKDCMRDPLESSFYNSVWNRVAGNNTKLFRRVFRCMPDSEVSTWTEYREYADYNERFRASMEGTHRPAAAAERESKSKSSDGQSHSYGHSHSHGHSHGHGNGHQTGQGPGSTAAAGVGAPAPVTFVKAVIQEQLAGHHLPGANRTSEQNPQIVVPDEDGEGGDVNENRPTNRGASMHKKTPPPIDTEKAAAAAAATQAHLPTMNSPELPGGDTPFPAYDLATVPTKSLELPPARDASRSRRGRFSNRERGHSGESREPSTPGAVGSVRRRRRNTTRGSRQRFTVDYMPTMVEAEDLLNMVQGNLVHFPYDWLLTEEINGNWGYQVDGVAPMAIYD